jgi:hypothetical protein
MYVCEGFFFAHSQYTRIELLTELQNRFRCSVIPTDVFVFYLVSPGEIRDGIFRWAIADYSVPLIVYRL